MKVIVLILIIAFLSTLPLGHGIIEQMALVKVQTCADIIEVA